MQILTMTILFCLSTLCLAKSVPYDKAIRVFWNDFREEVAIQIYEYIVDQLNVDVVIGHFALNEMEMDSADSIARPFNPDD